MWRIGVIVAIIGIELSYCGLVSGAFRPSRNLPFRQELGIIFPNLLAQDAAPTDAGTAPASISPPAESSAPSDTAAPADTSGNPSDAASPDSTAPAPADTPAPESTDSPVPAPSDGSAPSDTAAPVDLNAPNASTPSDSENPNGISPDQNSINQTSPSDAIDTGTGGAPPGDDIKVNDNTQTSPDTAAQDQTPASQSDTSGQTNPDQNNQEGVSQPSQDQTVSSQVLSPQESIVNAEPSAEIVQKSQIEETNLVAAQTPQDQENLLVQYATEKVDDIANSLTKTDFATTDFVAQRLNAQIDSVLNTFQQIPLEDQAAFKEKIQQFSATAETELRGQQLVVPEGLEQDLEIARGKLLLINSTP